MLGTTAVSGEFPEIYSIIKKKHCIWCYSHTLNLFKIVKKRRLSGSGSQSVETDENKIER